MQEDVVRTYLAYPMASETLLTASLTVTVEIETRACKPVPGTLWWWRPGRLRIDAGGVECCRRARRSDAGEGANDSDARYIRMYVLIELRTKYLCGAGPDAESEDWGERAVSESER